MAYGQNLYRRISGIYAVRIVVPDHLRARVRQREVHCTTGSARREVALEQARVVRNRWARLFRELDELDAISLALAEPWFKGEGLVDLDRAAQLFDLEPHALATLVANRGFALCATAAAWDARAVQDLGTVDIEDGAYLWQSVDNEGTTHQLHGPVSLSDSQSVARDLRYGGTSNVYQLATTSLAVGPFGGVFVRPGSVVLSSADMSVRQVHLEDIRITFARAHELPTYPIQEAQSRSMPAAPSSPPSSANTPVPTSATSAVGATVSSLIQSYILEQGTTHPPQTRAKWKPDEVERNRQKLRCFPEFMGDVQVTDLEAPVAGEELVRRYLNLLTTLPTGPALSRARRETHQGLAPELVRWANKVGAKRLEGRTAYDYLSTLSECIAWGIKRGLLKRNPVQNVIPRANGRQDAIRKDKIREPFTDEELNKIFSAPWFKTGGAAPTAKGAPNKHFRPFYYWLPLLALHTGGRANELGQLYLSDIQYSPEKIPFIRFQITHEDQMDGDEPDVEITSNDKSLKTVNANRDIPIHPTLVELGLMEYVLALKQIGCIRLFPELRFDQGKGYGLEARKWFNERFLGGSLKFPRNGTKVLHTMRHNYATAIPSDPRLERTKNQLMGHERGQTEAGVRYTGEASVSTTAPFIDALRFNLPVIAPFTIRDGIRATRVAANLKLKHVHRGK